MSRQKEITLSARLLLIEWLVEMVEHEGLDMETLDLALNIMDRFLSKQSQEIKKFQLLGLVCLYIAAKMEGDHDTPALVKDLIHMTEDSFTIDQAFALELEVLRQLEFRLTAPTPCWFLTYSVYAVRRLQEMADLQCFLLSLWQGKAHHEFHCCDHGGPYAKSMVQT